MEGVWRVWKVLEGLGGLEGVWRVWKVLERLEGFGVFAGWQTAALKTNRKPLLWPWPWGACLRSGLGPGVPVGEGVWRVFGGFGGLWRVFGGFWRVLERLEFAGFWSVWSGLEGLEGFGGFGRFGGFWRVLEGFGGFWRVWRVLERLECLRAGKRQL